MKLEKLSCPSCGAGIDMDIKGRKTLFCPFCGNQFSIDDGSRTITNNINISAKQTHDIHLSARYTDDAAVEKERRKSKENEQLVLLIAVVMIGTIILFIITFAFIAFLTKNGFGPNKRSESEELMQVGMFSDVEKGNYYYVPTTKYNTKQLSQVVIIDMDKVIAFAEIQ